MAHLHQKTLNWHIVHSNYNFCYQSLLFFKFILFSRACGIEVDDLFFVTGGRSHGKTVIAYTEAGVGTYLPNLRTGRYDHACSKFVTEEGEPVSSFSPRIIN